MRKRILSRILFVGGIHLAALFSIARATAAPQENVSRFYQNHTVNVIVGYSAGGGFDLYARLLAQHLADHIPGHPHVIVENMPGAGGLKSALYLLNVAPRDGSYIATTGRTVFFAPMLSDTKFDGTQFDWLGSITDDTSVCLSSARSPVQSWTDMLKQTFLAGGIGPEDDLDVASNYLKHMFHAKIKLITGYPGSSDVKAAMERGEIEGMCGLSYSALISTYASDLKSHSIRIMLQMASKKSPALPDVPYLGDYASPEQKKVLQILLDPLAMSRPFAVPPGVPADRLAALQKAFDETMHDPQFISAAGRANLPVNPISGEAVKQLVSSLYKIPHSITDQARNAIQYDADK